MVDYVSEWSISVEICAAYVCKREKQIKVNKLMMELIDAEKFTVEIVVRTEKSKVVLNPGLKWVEELGWFHLRVEIKGRWMTKNRLTDCEVSHCVGCESVKQKEEEWESAGDGDLIPDASF